MVKTKTGGVPAQKATKQKAAVPTKAAKAKVSKKAAAKLAVHLDASSEEEQLHHHYPRLSSAAFHLHGDPALAAELAIQRQLESMVAAMRESLYRDVYQAVKRDVLEVVETHVQTMREEIAEHSKKSGADVDLLKASTTAIDANLNALSASLARYKAQFKVFKKEASSAIVKLANDCSQRDLSTIPFSSGRDRDNHHQQQQQDDQQWQQVNEHIATLHRENQRQFRTLEQQLVQLVDRNGSDGRHDYDDFLPAVRDELSACVSQCNQLQHELVQLVQRVDSQGRAIQRLNSTTHELERSMHDATHDHFSDVEEIGMEHSDRRLGRHADRTVAASSAASASASATMAAEIADIRQRLQTLSTTTVSACRSLSSGLKDVQKAIIGFYRWAEAVHDGMDSMSQSLGMENPVPRLKLHAEKKQQDR